MKNEKAEVVNGLWDWVRERQPKKEANDQSVEENDWVPNSSLLDRAILLIFLQFLHIAYSPGPITSCSCLAPTPTSSFVQVKSRKQLESQLG